MAYLAVPLLLLLALSCSVHRAEGTGLVITLYNKVNEPTNATNTVVTPSPIKGVPAAYPGCTDLPTGFVPASGIFAWKSSAGTDACSYAIFYQLQHCYSSPDGSTPAIKASSSNTTINNFTAHSYSADITKAQSAGCAYNFNPCNKYPCSDPNAFCSPSTVVVYPTATTSITQWTSRQCICNSGFILVNGTCTDPCKGFVCPAPATCQLQSDNVTPFCWCPDEYQWNSTTKMCDYIGVQLWKDAVNGAREVNNLPDYTWDPILASNATTLAQQNYPNCTTYPTSPFKKITGIQQDGYFSSSTVLAKDAVAAWMDSNITPPSNRARIFSVGYSFSTFGCGKRVCYGGAMFICLFV